MLDELHQVYGDHSGVFFAEALFAAAAGDDAATARWLAGAVERSPRAAQAAAGEPTLAAALARMRS